jgi:hypothetical protein
MNFPGQRKIFFFIGVLILISLFTILSHRDEREFLPFAFIGLTNTPTGKAAVFRFPKPGDPKFFNGTRWESQKVKLLWKLETGQVKSNSEAEFQLDFPRGITAAEIRVELPSEAASFQVIYEQRLRQDYRRKGSTKILISAPWTRNQTFISDWMKQPQ